MAQVQEMSSTEQPMPTDSKSQEKFENRQHITRIHLILTVFLLWILSTAGVGLLFFKNGFLLTRNALPNMATHDYSSDPKTANPLPAKFSKAIVVIIDALRYDFAAPAVDAKSGELVQGIPYRNQMPFIRNIIQDQPDSAILFEFVADAPTTTMQRIKGFTTGTLPTFVDAGSNFAGTEILEDTWLAQLRKAGKHMSFLGDDTWGLLFPNMFNESYPFSSFDVWDLHSVDNGILSNFDGIFYNRNTSAPWELIVTHFLGVDHCGHRYGPDHAEMAPKLAQLDGFLEKLYSRIDDKTLVMVFGDHGMDRKGDHGGETAQETGAALLLLSKAQLRATESQKELMTRLGLASADGTVPHFIHHSQGLNNGARSVQQIDLVPSLSLLLGLPIPYNNLGMVIPELFLQSDTSVLLEALRRNAVQVHTYLGEYARMYPASDIAKNLAKSLGPQFIQAQAAYQAWLDLPTSTPRLQDSLRHYALFLRTSLASCRASWAQFDPAQIQMGMSLFFCICGVLLYHCLFRSHPSSQPHFSKLNGPMLAYIFAGATLGVFFAFNGSVDAAFDLLGRRLDHIERGDVWLYGGFFGSCMGYFLNAFMDYRASDSAFALSVPFHSEPFKRLLAGDGWLVVFNLVVMGVAGFLSASVWMTENEDTVVMYLLQGFTGALLLFGFFLRSREPEQAIASLRNRLLRLGVLLLVLNQIISFVTVCREEQLPYCYPSFYGRFSWEGGSIGTTASPWVVGLFSIVCITFPYVVRQIFISTRNFYTSAPIWIEWGFRGCLALVAVYWFLDTSDSPMLKYLPIVYAKNLLIRLAFCLAVLFGTGNFFLNTLLIDVQMVRTDAAGSAAHSMVVMGFGNAYGAPMLLFFTVVFLPLLMAQQPMGGIVLSLAVIQMVVVVDVLDVLKDIFLLILPKHPEAKMHPRALEFTGASLFYLISYQAFFATGHQATLSSLQWKAGFIGLSSMSWFLSPALVTVNTLGGFILGGVGVLLVVYWKAPPHQGILQRTLPYSISRVALFFTLLHCIGLTGSAGWAAYHQRHLLVWKLFAPRFLLGALAMISGVASLLFLALFLPSPHILNEVSDILIHLKQE
ncbi:mannose-ethanolamine phosphotransferase gpi13 [Entomophthora muscae]|uniref:Mannose-ethanolamine phosphotransferase gpi13 n=1 Tax=Entomophthora muscae TaxID=34485 RepID=A0ACC2UF31_9FUNG|nr:mannose-ethanolamine phosphotransferase gpi13 [Entomophthora muscae]